MNILLINAFGNSSSGKKKFTSFLDLIKKIFKKVSENSGIDNFNYIIRDPSKLEDYLFNYYSNPTDETSESQNRKNFNSLDMVFIDGIENYSPWKKRSHYLTKFVELCKLSNKVLYAGGVALEILIYYLSIGSINEYNIINSNGEIKALEEINKIPLKFLNRIRKNELFLDFVTGDLLEYRNNENFWEPIMNIGLHHQISAENYISRGKFVLSENFKGKDFIKNKNAMNTYCQEIKIKITRQYISHYLVKNCSIEFIALSSLEWFPHFVNVTAKKLQFKTICQSDKGPIVIEHDNSIGVGFHSQERFKDSVNILENFIKTKFNEVKDKLLKIKNIKIFISTNMNNEISQVFKIFKDNDDRLRGKFDPDEEIPSNAFSLLGKVTKSCLFNRTKKVKHEAKHVGQGINNREMIFVENNFINQRNFYRLKNNKKQRNNIDNNNIYNNRNNNVKYSSYYDKQKRNSSNSFKDNKSLTLINSFKNRKQSISVDKKRLNRVSATVKRKKIFKELKNKIFPNTENYNNNIYLKLKTFTNNDNNKNNIEEYNNSQLKQLIMPKTTNNTYYTEEGKETEKENEIDDFQNYKSIYPRLPTLNELRNYLNNSNIVKTQSFDFKKTKKNKFEYVKTEPTNNYSRNKTLDIKNETDNNYENIKFDNKDLKKSKKTNFVNNNKNNNNINKDINIYKTYRPVISKKYDISNRFKNF